MWNLYFTAVDCGALTVPQNGSLVQNQTTYTSIAYVQCDEGFIQRGSTVRVCQANRTWSGNDTVCEGTTGLVRWLLSIFTCVY